MSPAHPSWIQYGHQGPPHQGSDAGTVPTLCTGAGRLALSFLRSLASSHHGCFQWLIHASSCHWSKLPAHTLIFIPVLFKLVFLETILWVFVSCPYRGIGFLGSPCQGPALCSPRPPLSSLKSSREETFSHCQKTVTEAQGTANSQTASESEGGKKEWALAGKAHPQVPGKSWAGVGQLPPTCSCSDKGHERLIKIVDQTGDQAGDQAG